MSQLRKIVKGDASLLADWDDAPEVYAAHTTKLVLHRPASRARLSSEGGCPWPGVRLSAP